MSVRPRGLTVFSTGNEELDGRLGGGVPHPSFILIEGENGTAKTTLALQIVFGALRAGFRVTFFTTESTPALLLQQAKNITFNLTRFYLSGQLRVYSLYTRGGMRPVTPETIRSAFSSLISYISSVRDADLVAVDSLTTFLVYAGSGEVTRFLQAARSLTARGSSLLVTLHAGVVGEEVAKAVRASSDVYYKLGLANVGGKTVKVLQIVKARGAPEPIEGTVAFDVDPAFGIKIVPVVVAQS